MARIRTIKPEFWTSEQVADCSPTARLLFIGLWNFCDDGGVHLYSLKRIKMEIFPGDDCTLDQIQIWINELFKVGLLKFYQVDTVHFLKVSGWRHQKIEKASFKHPQPDENTKFADHSPTIRRPFADKTPADVDVDVDVDVSSLEGNGRELKKKSSSQSLNVIKKEEISETEKQDETMTNKIGLFEFKILYSKTFNELMPGGLNNIAMDLCMRYPRVSLEDAFGQAALHNGKSLKYVITILEKKTRGGLSNGFKESFLTGD